MQGIKVKLVLGRVASLLVTLARMYTLIPD